MVLSLLGEGDGMGWDELIFLVWFAGLLEFYLFSFYLVLFLFLIQNQDGEEGKKEGEKERKKERRLSEHWGL